MLKKLARYFYKRIYLIKQIYSDIKKHSKFKNDHLPNIFSRILEQTILLLRRGITVKNYYIYRLYRKDIKWHKKMEFIGDYFRRHWQWTINPPKYFVITDDKVIFSNYMKSGSLPVNSIIATIGKDGRSESGQPLETDHQIRTWLNNELYENVFLKPRSGERALGILSLGERSKNNTWVTLPKKEEIDVEGIIDHFHRFPSYSFIVEPRLKPHHDLEVFGKYVLHTARVITLYDDSKVEILSGALKIATGVYAGDNLMKGNLVAPIDVHSGIIGKGVFIKDGFVQTIETHPETKERIKNFKIPDWPLAIEVLKKAAIHLSFFKMLGWDIGFTDQGPVIIEANRGFDPILNQVSADQGMLSIPLFKKYFDKNNIYRKIKII